jgi:hypothetical protein
VVRSATFLFGAIFGMLLPSMGFAADAKTTAIGNLEKAGLMKPSTAETADLIVIGPHSETKLKTLAEAAQKVFTVARKELKAEAKDALWPGKLLVVVVPDRRQFSLYQFEATKKRPEKDEWFAVDVRGDQPTTAVVVEKGEKAKDSDWQTSLSVVVAVAVLNKKAGTGGMAGSLPEWVQTGFAKLMAVKAGGSSAMADFRTKSRAAVNGTSSKPVNVKLADLWGAVKVKDPEIVSASAIEFMLSGGDADKFLRFASGFKLTAQGEAPTPWAALEAGDWKPDEFDLAWKLWLKKAK